jgi:hypothetical protein
MAARIVDDLLTAFARTHHRSTSVDPILFATPLIPVIELLSTLKCPC